MLPFEEDLDVDKVHVQTPSSVILLCGGPCDPGVPVCVSLRDAFRKIADIPALRNRDVVLAEDVTKDFGFSAYYKDILKFEIDLAQIVDLILLFSESEGSLAELGAFAMVEEIAQRLLVVIRDKYWSDDSFVKLGPLRHLEVAYGSQRVYVVDDNDIGIAPAINKSILRDRLQSCLKSWFETTSEPTTFDKERSGHVIKLIVGLIQEYGALTLPEIMQLLERFKAPQSAEAVESFLLCAQAVLWVEKRRKGSTDYYFANNLPDDAAIITLRPTAELRDKRRRRLRIRDHWNKTDPDRDRGIKEIFGKPSR